MRFKKNLIIVQEMEAAERDQDVSCLLCQLKMNYTHTHRMYPRVAMATAPSFSPRKKLVRVDCHTCVCVCVCAC